MTAVQWLVLDNLKHDWPYMTSLNYDLAAAAYRWCVNNEYIRDGRITPEGEAAMLLYRQRSKLPISDAASGTKGGG